MNKTSNYPRSKYEAKSFSVASGLTNYNVKTSEGLFAADYIEHDYINIGTNQAITVRFNDTSYGAFPIAANSALTLSGELKVTNIYITNSSGSTATISLLLI